ncbi:Membrane protein implicated in regulation of membrane protease activity [Ruminococcus sp. YE71]|uniref:NfeD family protein n=1 Tax=unclassified Ruminococcus TaxID=2608920 RepID=UPI00088A81B4|nr:MULTISPECIES: NfeD family protein [unclassified Ruminococcus]SDA18855.1 Membrane protein implicated in regulation of membrane protease activity [Ruminococcus sp. YE78]SFW29175.1 Membrane protein implicated in regulation of membrane protease activity [Ruminococcus sp. YE71]
MKDILEALVSDPYVFGWFIAFLMFLVAEAATLHALVSIWFAIAAVLAMIAAVAGLAFIWQLLIFVAASVVLLFATKSIVKRIRESRTSDPTEDYDIGKTAIVIEGIDNEQGLGRVKLDGVDWAARSADGGEINEGAVVTVRKIDGSKLIVTR